MRIGSNLLNLAHTIIGTQTGMLERPAARVKNAVGLYENQYQAPVPVVGSFQPVPRQVYQQLGLDFNSSYLMLYTSTPLDDIQRGETGDIIRFNSQRFRAVGNNEWTPVDGWNGVLLIRVRENE